MSKDKLSKILLIITTLLVVSQAAVLLLVNTVWAGGSTAGMLWTKTACDEKCVELGGGSGCWPVGCQDCANETEGGVPCLVPPPEVELKVPFIGLGGEKISGGVVRGISGYVAAALSWSIYVISTLAVVMLMVAGFQWIVAAGNASAIGKAKSRISNALIAIVLVLGSVVLLRTINPALVELTDIKVMMIPTILQATLFCSEKGDAKIMYALVADEVEPETAIYSIPSDKLECGKEYYIQNSKGQTCMGRVCPPSSDDMSNECILDVRQEQKNEFICSDDLCKAMGKSREECFGVLCNSTDKNALRLLNCEGGYDKCCAQFSQVSNKQYCYYVEDYNFDDGCVFVDLSGDKCGNSIKGNCYNYGFIPVETQWFSYALYGTGNVSMCPELYKSVCNEDACGAGCTFSGNTCVSRVEAGISTPNCASRWEEGVYSGPPCNGTCYLACTGSCSAVQTSGIEPKQCFDASPALSNFIKCLREKLDQFGVSEITITSISDDHGLKYCREKKPFPAECFHEENSCHYGGGSHTDGSYAVDVSCSGLGAGDFQKSVGACGGVFLNECPGGGREPGDHYHASAPGCRE